jgi:alcohol dehydrogenase YqhD (iron-dependent ADH family)
MTDDELIKRLRSCSSDEAMWSIEAADRIEQLLESIKNLSHLWATAAVNREVSEGKLEKAIDALRLVTDACDEGKMVSLGIGGMTIDAQIRRSVYNKVPAWPIEEARSVLDELGRPE